MLIGDVDHILYQVRALTEYRPGAVLGQLLPVPVDPDHPVQDQEDLTARITLADQYVARGGPADRPAQV